jgi:hypothetical protein
VNKPMHPTATESARRLADRHARRPVSMRGYLRGDGGVTAEIRVVDLSYEGCCVETAAELQAGQEVRLSVLGGGIEAVVRWSSHGKAGLVFKAEAAPTERRPRAAKRASVGAEVMLRRLGKVNYRVCLSDLSASGCKVELVERPAVGEHMMIKFEGFEVLDAQVCWVEGFIAGLRFEKPFHPAVFDLLLARLR